MIVAFPLSLSPASSSAATRKRKKKTKTRKMCQTRRARARAAPLVSPHLPSSRLCCCCSKIFFFVSSSSSSCTSASFCTPLSLCLPPIVFSHNLSLSSRTFSPSLRTRSSSLGLLCRRTLVRTSRRRLCTLSRGSVSTGLGRTSRAGTTRSLRNTRFGRSSSRRLKSALQRFPKDFVERSVVKVFLPPKDGIGYREEAEEAEGTKAHHRVRVVLRVVSSSTTHHHPL